MFEDILKFWYWTKKQTYWNKKKKKKLKLENKTKHN